MVFFTCNACGESLKKNQVEKHYMHKCRRCEVLTCVDCHKDFPGDSYQAHTKCITEDEKYSAKGWAPKASANKGEKKQLQWISNLQALVDENAATLDGETRKILDTVMQHDNIPRKKAKFMNFVKNILRHVRPAAIDNTWELFEQALKPKVEPEAPPKEPVSIPVEDDDAKEEVEEVEETNESRQGVPMFTGRPKTKKAKKKDKGKENQSQTIENGGPGPKKKRKRAENDLEDEVEAKKPNRENPGVQNGAASPEKSGKFVWEDVITGLLQKKGAMKVNKLKKKVVAEYLSQHEGTHKSEEELASKLDKKLKKNKSFRILKDVVSLHE
ncbi:hypothetical protein TCAL_08201 [Tigriopus californicus]|uniref:Uncharacterized protein n=1 Tax=Tigriopus californicus TaxID=6832 RepID=A0A553NDS0_TIGCA|nr:cell growth-regulating nucleolar protein-like [Tigriopus californicus]TRY63558.1 hypothetical protein TCAL_08201 [Tigriopus californicus]|eukprot:TCALIF_08201-PA protein Name:"Similar to LYAR Cell growth-regulating nucleolar protein (Homo sapiens)" AED:0.01 eAED:0.01 QI:75/1/1/1/1/1/2/60/327